jgi:putrescine---pyruvate transaminase
MEELAYYNTFFQTTHVPAIALAAEIAELAPGDLNHVFFAGSGSEANDTNIRLVRRYWDVKGCHGARPSSRARTGITGPPWAAAALGDEADPRPWRLIDGIEHIDQPDWWSEGGDMTPDDFGLLRARELEEKILQVGPTTWRPSSASRSRARAG